MFRRIQKYVRKLFYVLHFIQKSVLYNIRSTKMGNHKIYIWPILELHAVLEKLMNLQMILELFWKTTAIFKI